jgi:photosystem II stability/assembly factor-like uncharacterized protein
VSFFPWPSIARQKRSHRIRDRLLRPARPQPLQLEELESRCLLSGTSLPGQPSWTSLGPAPILDGQTAGSQPVSGRISAIAADPRDANTIYLAAAGGGVWKTTDAGNHWTPLTDDQATLFMGAIALAPSDPDVIYAGTGEATNSVLSFTGHGVLKSTDAGASWTLLGADVFDRHTISQIVVAPDDPNTVYVAVGGSGTHGLAGNTGIWRSTDGGATWTNTTAAITTTASFSDVEIDPTHPETLYAAVGSFRGSVANGVYKSTDGGNTWLVAGNFPMDARDGRITVAITPSNPQTLYASISASGQAGTSLGRLVAILKSTDGGDTWTALPNPPDLGGNGWYGLPLAVDPTNPNTLYASAGGNPIVESNNGGLTWFSLVVGADGNGPHTDHHAFAFDASGHLLDGNDGGIWRLDDPRSASLHWTDLNTNLQLTQFIGIAVNPTNPTIVYGGSQDNGTSEDTGSLAWTLIRLGDGGFVRVDPANPSTVYHEYVNIDLERSDDGGITWIQKSTGINHSDPSNTYLPYVMDPVNAQRLLLGTNHVYETTNRGDLWRPISQPGVGGWTVSANIDTLATAASDPNTIYASAGGHLFVTFDDGVTWQQRDIAGVTDHFQDIQIDPTDKLTAFAVRDRFGGGKVFKTSDGGLTWTDISGNLPDLPAYTLALDPSSKALYVGTDDGVYLSTNQDGNWARFGTGLPHAQVRDLELLADLQLLVAGTHGRGAWEVSTAVQAVAPSVASVVINDGSAQRSMVTSITVTFSSIVTLDPGAFEVLRQEGGAFHVNVTETVVNGQSVDTLTFSGANIIGGSLPDGHYTLIIHGDLVHDSSSGLALDGAGAGTAGSDHVETFFRLFGDADGDGHVDVRDLLRFAGTLGKRAGDQGFLGYFDYNGDGRVDLGDLLQLLRRFG